MSLVTEQIDFVNEKSLKVGVSYRLPFTISDDDKPVILHNFTGKMAIKKYHDGVIIYKPNIEIVQPNQGIIHAVFDGTDTRVIKPGKYKYDIFLFNFTGVPYSFIEGTIMFSASITDF